MELSPYIDKFARRLAEVEAALSDPAAFDNPQRAQELSKEYSRLKELVATGAAYLKTRADLAENRALLARADRLYEQLLGQAREFLGQQIAIFTSILDRQDPQPIKQARIDLGELLDQIESDSYL